MDDALVECEPLNVLIDVRREYAGLLLYVAGSLYQEMGNIHLIVARQLQSLTWSDLIGLVPGTLATHYLEASTTRSIRGHHVLELAGGHRRGRDLTQEFVKSRHGKAVLKKMRVVSSLEE